MTRVRLNGLYLLLLGSLAFILLGFLFARASPVARLDFKSSYYSARCLIQHCDPYNESEVLRIYQAEGGDRSSDTAAYREDATRYLYPPTAFFFTVPFAMLPWGSAIILWFTLTIGGLIFASFLVYRSGANYAPILSGALIGFLLANSEVLFILANPSGIAISLCVIAVWCFLQEQCIPAGILCLAVSLAVKPQDAGLVWVYLLLAGGAYRKRALQTLLVTITISLPCVLWVGHVSPHWIQELRSNISTVHGGLNDPATAANGAHGLLDLQVVIGYFWSAPRIYNLVSYFLCAVPLLIGAVVALQSRPSPKRAWLAIAAVAAFSMLPVQHHLYDTKLLLLTVPACAMLWAEGGLIGWLALLVNSAGFVLTGDLSLAILSGFIAPHLVTAQLRGQILTAIELFQTPLILLVMGIFYLWVYLRCCSSRSQGQGTATVGQSGLRVS